MAFAEHTFCLGERGISSEEDIILKMLRSRPDLTKPVIDLPSLQELCLREGVSLMAFSRGFIHLLIRRLIEPHGEFRYAVSSGLQQQPVSQQEAE